LSENATTRIVEVFDTALRVYYLPVIQTLELTGTLLDNVPVTCSCTTLLTTEWSTIVDANISKSSLFGFSEIADAQGVKKITHSIKHLVSRKAMQRYVEKLIRTKFFKHFFSKKIRENCNTLYINMINFRRFWDCCCVVVVYLTPRGVY